MTTRYKILLQNFKAVIIGEHIEVNFVNMLVVEVSGWIRIRTQKF